MKIIVRDLAELPAAARTIAPLLVAHGGVVAFYGEMGAGKTTLISAILQEMGSTDEVSSPTFALVNEYVTDSDSAAGPVPALVYHFDFYRIDSPAEAFDLGYEEYFFSGALCLVEWPEKIAELLPPDTLSLTITRRLDGSREITLSKS